MRHSLCGMLIGAAALVASSSIAFAGEQTLEFKLVVKSLDPYGSSSRKCRRPNNDCHQGVRRRVLQGRQGCVKDFIASSETRERLRPHARLQHLYVRGRLFDHCELIGEYKDGKAHGDYTILSGTGVYANATGTGSFDSVPAKFKGAGLLDGKFDVKTPGS